MALASLALGLLAAVPALAATPSTGVVPPSATPFGKTYAEWSAAWWQYAFSMPTPSSPLFDASGSYCDVRQSGPVFFLVGTFSATPDPANPGAFVGNAERSCAVPLGKHLFFPILTNECSLLEQPGMTDQQLATCAASPLNTPDLSVSASIDGVPVDNLSAFRVQSPPFTFALPANNILSAVNACAVPCQTATMSRSVADGYYLLLAPLSPGAHTVEFHGHVPGFTSNIVYHLTVLGN